MKSIINNPYRIAGIPANCSEKDILKQKSKIKRFSEVGKEITSEYDFPFFPLFQRDTVIIDQAFADIEQNLDKVTNSLFWFINLNPIDNTAIQYLISGNLEKAREIWERFTFGKEVNAKNFSAFNNIGTLYLLEQSEESLRQGIASKINLIASDSFPDFVRAVADETFVIDPSRQIEILINELLEELNGTYSTTDIFRLFGDSNEIAQKYLSKKFTEGPVHTIETQIELAKNKRIEDGSHAHHYGTALYNNTKNELLLLRSILGTAHLQYKLLADNVAKELLQCGIDYFNEWQDTRDPSIISLRLLQLAKSLTTNRQTQERIDENTQGMQEFARTAMAKLDIEAVIKLLDNYADEKKGNLFGLNYQSWNRKKDFIKKAERLIREATPRLLNIKSILKGNNEIYLQLSTSIVSLAQKFLIDTINDAQQPSIVTMEIDFSDLKSKLDSAWKVILRIGSLDMTSQFKASYDENLQALKNICKKVDISTPAYNYGKIPQLNFVLKSAEITNTGENNSPLLLTHPLYEKYTRFIGLKLNVVCFENESTEFFLKYINPDGKYKHNDSVSPKGYTKSAKLTLSPNSQVLDLGSWGNATSCSYAIGTHRIEVWVHGFMIYSKEFTIDLSPAQKLEKQLKDADVKLDEIKQAAYLTSEINAGKNELIEIKRFKLFRGSGERVRQIAAQERKIKDLIAQADMERTKAIQHQESLINGLKSVLAETEH